MQVLQGRVQIRTRNRAVFDAVLKPDADQSHNATHEAAAAVKGVTEHEMQELFESIDVDGSGRQVVRQLQALRLRTWS